MDTFLEARNLIGQTEEELRRLLTRAAENAEYDHLQVLAEWAKPLRRISSYNTAVKGTRCRWEPTWRHSGRSAGTAWRSGEGDTGAME